MVQSIWHKTTKRVFICSLNINLFCLINLNLSPLAWFMSINGFMCFFLVLLSLSSHYICILLSSWWKSWLVQNWRPCVMFLQEKYREYRWRLWVFFFFFLIFLFPVVKISQLTWISCSNDTTYIYFGRTYRDITY